MCITKVKITGEKIFWLIIALLATVILFLITSPNFQIADINSYDSAPITVGDLVIKFNCTVIDKEYFAVNSKIKCSSKITSPNYEHYNVNTILQIVDPRNFTKVYWGCTTNFETIKKDEYTDYKECKNFIYDDLFMPENSGDYKLVLYNADFCINDVVCTGTGDAINVPFSSSFYVMSVSEANSYKIANNSLLIAFLALLLFVPTLVLEIRKLLNEK